MKRTTSALPKERILILRTVMILLIAAVFGRYFQVTILDHAKALESAKTQYGVKETIQAKRGKIYMRDLNGGPNYPVALNIDSFTIVADPFLIHEKAEAASALSPVLEIAVEDLMGKLNDDHKRFVVLKKKLTKEQAEKVEQLNLKGVTAQAVPTRFYPESGLAAQTVGFISAEGEGQYGIERFFDEDLKGYDGSLVGEKDAKHRIIAEGKSAKAKDGTDIVLTIDGNIQYMAETKLAEAIKKYEADSGSVVIIDVKTGAILALANSPGFNLNEYGNVPKDQVHLYENTAVTTPWEPGSIFKPFTLAAGMDQGKFEPDTRVNLPCSVRVNGYDIYNAEKKCYANPSVIEILAQSINLGTIWAADQIGNDVFAQYMKDFGFGVKTGLELQPESAGNILPVKQWQDVNRATMSFGQGLSTTPIQIAAAYAALGNGGKLMHPYVVAQRIEADGRTIDTQPKEIRQVIKPETVTKITTLLEDVVTDGHGKKAAVPGYKIAGKTGTAQVVGKDGKYEENAHIGSFAGFFPSNDPKFAMLVKLDRPKAVEFAESSAAPTFGEIAAWLLHYAKVPPTENLGQ
jgi:cell division protein FtsI (penicillin-binding protein 3)